MLLTEDEAKIKWCPQAQDENDGGSYNRFLISGTPLASYPIVCVCLASQCMWWRWESNSIPYLVSPTIGPKGSPPQGEGWEWDEEGHRWIKYLPETRRGYCGIAGRAE